MNNWFGVHHFNGHESSNIHDILTEEQVLSLPEIVYQKQAEAETNDAMARDSSNSNPAIVINSSVVEGPVDGDHAVVGTSCDGINENCILRRNICRMRTSSDRSSIGAAEEEELGREDIGTSPRNMGKNVLRSESHENLELDKETTELDVKLNIAIIERPSSAPSVTPNSTIPTQEAEGSDEEQPPLGSPGLTRAKLGPYTTTKCTVCSICIDEFEDGEKIRLLPRCGHAFHTECILPWLTERQGCCPLCKTSVLETEEKTESSAQGGENHTAAEAGEAEDSLADNS
jgi:hypothetical protein